jgi:hypothetical protein
MSTRTRYTAIASIGMPNTRPAVVARVSKIEGRVSMDISYPVQGSPFPTILLNTNHTMNSAIMAPASAKGASTIVSITMSGF